MTMRTIDFRFLVIRNGGEFCRLHPANNSKPMLECDDADSISTHLSGSFMLPGEEVDWTTDEIQPEMILNGVPYKLGRYLPSTVDEVDDGVQKYLQITSYDRGWLIRDHRAESRPFFASGTNYLEAVVSILASSGITQIAETACGKTMTEDREDWDVGISWLEIANQLLDEINYEHVWFDGDGTCVLEPKTAPTGEHIDRILDENVIESMITPGYRIGSDIFNRPNVFICVCSNADKGAAMRAVAENTNPQSPISIPRRGRRIAKVIQVDNIASQEDLQVFADRQVTDSMMLGETIQIQTALLPGFGVGDMVALRYGDLYSVCRDRKWSMQLGVGGKMSHTLERVLMNLE